MKLNTIVLTALTAGILWSCQKEDLVDNTPELTNETQSTVTKNFQGTEIQVIPQGDGIYRNGDILFHEGQFLPDGYVPTVSAPGEVAKLGLGASVSKWSNNTVVYVIQPGLSSSVLGALRDAMDEWTSKTNVKFKERTTERTYVTIRDNGDSCNCGSATLGTFGSSGTMNLGRRSSAGLIVHELGHTLGFLHEQNRPDRDDYLTVDFSAVQPGARDQYFKSPNSTPLTAELDFNSIMMYNSTTFAISFSVPTMTRNDNGLPVRGAGNTLTQLDIQGANSAYPGSTSNPPGSICDGVEEFDDSLTYVNGDKVTFEGDLYEAINFAFVLIGPCN